MKRISLVVLACFALANVGLTGCGGDNSATIPSDYSNAKLPDKPPEVTSTGPSAPPAPSLKP